MFFHASYTLFSFILLGAHAYLALYYSLHLVSYSLCALFIHTLFSHSWLSASCSPSLRPRLAACERRARAPALRRLRPPACDGLTLYQYAGVFNLKSCCLAGRHDVCAYILFEFLSRKNKEREREKKLREKVEWYRERRGVGDDGETGSLIVAKFHMSGDNGPFTFNGGWRDEYFRASVNRLARMCGRQLLQSPAVKVD